MKLFYNIYKIIVNKHILQGRKKKKKTSARVSDLGGYSFFDRSIESYDAQKCNQRSEMEIAIAILEYAYV